MGQFARIAVGVGILILIAIIYIPKLLYTDSVSAVVSAKIIRILTPIEGELKQTPPPIGTELGPNDTIGIIENPIQDRVGLENLETDMVTLARRVAALKEEDGNLDKILEDLQKKKGMYYGSLKSNLQHLLEEAKLRAEELKHTLKEHAVELERQRTLYKNGTVSKASFDEAFYQHERSLELLGQAQTDVTRIGDELKALEDGISINHDGKRETTYYEIRTDEIKIRKTDINSRIEEYAIRRDALQQRINLEKKRLDLQTKRVIKNPPINSVIWRNHVQAGTHVNAKEPLVEIIDCSNVFIDVALQERYFEKIKPGQIVIVKLYGSDKKIKGIVQAVRGGLIEPETQGFLAGINTIRRSREIQVLISIDERQLKQTKGDFCHVGRNATVYF